MRETKVSYNTIVKTLLSSVAVGVLFALFAFFFANNNLAQQVEKENAAIDSIVTPSAPNEFRVSDTYDSESSRITTFFNQAGSLQVLRDTYSLIKQNPHYLEIATQDIEYLGMSGFDSAMTPDPTGESNNQEDDQGAIFTPLNAIEMNAASMLALGIDGMFVGPKGLTIKNWNGGHAEIPVFAGVNFKRYFKAGDTFDGRYLGLLKNRYRIAGFLERGSSVTLAEETYDLDNYLVTPVFAVGRSMSYLEQKILLSVKCEGFLHYDTDSEVEECWQALADIAEKTGFAFQLRPQKRDLETFLKLGSVVYLPCTILVFCLLLIVLFMLTKSDKARLRSMLFLAAIALPIWLVIYVYSDEYLIPGSAIGILPTLFIVYMVLSTGFALATRSASRMRNVRTSTVEVKR